MVLVYLLGGNQRSFLKNSGKRLPHSENNESNKNTDSQNQVFDVVEFLNTDKTMVELDLFNALLVPGIKIESTKDVIVSEKTPVELLPKDECLKYVPQPDVFVLRNMSVAELQMDCPSKLGYFVCKKFIEVRSNLSSKGKVFSSNLSIPHFMFDCKSPDDIGLANRRWHHS